MDFKIIFPRESPTFLVCAFTVIQVAFGFNLTGQEKLSLHVSKIED